MKPASKLIVFIFIFLVLATSANAQSPREQLNQMVQHLQKTPEKILLGIVLVNIQYSLAVCYLYDVTNYEICDEVE